MIAVVVYAVFVGVAFVLAVRLGMILSVRIDRRLAPPDAAPPSEPHEEQP